MRRRMLIRALTLLTPLLVTACSGGREAPPLQLELIQASQGVIAARTAGASPERPPLRRADLDALEGSFMEITRERLAQTAYLYVHAVRQDDQPGTVTVWRSEDDATFAMRNGVLIATRGLGGDILSSSVQVAQGRPGPSASGAHVQMIRGGDVDRQRLAMACELRDLGAAMVEIVEIRYATRHLRQHCTGAGGEITNDYWVDAAAGLVWQSRQWAGPHIGYLRFRRLTN
jgi:group 4 capsule polysaccharide lipoprotein GfcB/YjbF